MEMVFDGEGQMDQTEDPRELERKIEQASRIAAVADTRPSAFAEPLKTAEILIRSAPVQNH